MTNNHIHILHNIIVCQNYLSFENVEWGFDVNRRRNKN